MESNSKAIASYAGGVSTAEAFLFDAMRKHTFPVASAASNLKIYTSRARPESREAQSIGTSDRPFKFAAEKHHKEDEPVSRHNYKYENHPSKEPQKKPQEGKNPSSVILTS